MLLLQILLLLLVGITLKTSAERQSNVAQLPPEVLYKDGDIMLGLIAHVRGYSLDPVCSETLAPVAMYTIPYAVDYAVGIINAMNDLLPNITLGYIVLDDCMRDIPAIPRMLQLLPLFPEDAVNRQLSVGSNYDIAAAIGPQSSAVSIMYAAAFSFFQIPLIGASATSDDLSDKTKYSNYFRVVGPDRYQSRAVVTFMAGMNWTYISVVYMEADYGYNGNKYMIKLAQELGVCIEESYPVNFDFTDDDYMDLVLDIMSPERKAKVLMLYIYPPRIVMFMKAYKRAGGKGELIFIMPDCMVPHMLYGYHDLIIGSFHMVPYIPDQPGFRNYYESIDPWSIPNDPWLPMVWEELFSCSMNSTGDKPRCTNQESLKESPRYFFEPTSMPFTDAVYAAANALDSLVRYHCPESRLNRTALRKCVAVPGLLAEYLRNVSYDAPSGMHIEFDANGDMIRAHSIKQLQRLPNGRYHFVEAAYYDPFQKDLKIYEELMQWDSIIPEENLQASEAPESICSYPCLFNQIRIQGEVECCWDCRACRLNEIISMNGTKCIECPVLFWPEENLRICRPIQPSYLTWNQPYGLAMMLLASTGFLASIKLFSVLIYNRNRRIVKGSSLEISLLIVIGTALSFLTIPTFIIRPTNYSCVLSRTGFAISITFIFGSLCVKLVRIFRIFQASNKFSRQLWFASTTSTLVFCTIVICLQIAITVVCAVLLPAYADFRMPIRTEAYVELQCDLNQLGILIPLSYNLLLTVISAMLGFLTRKLPDNFNESWYIFVSVCTTLFIWIAFLTTYFAAFYAYHKAVLLAFALYLNSVISLICLFGPKVYAIYYMKDEEIKVTNFMQPSSIKTKSMAPVTETVNPSSQISE